MREKSIVNWHVKISHLEYSSTFVGDPLLPFVDFTISVYLFQINVIDEWHVRAKTAALKKDLGKF